MVTYKNQMLALWREYENEVGFEAITTPDFAAWAIRSRKWFPKPQDIVRRCAADMADALRQEMRTDANGITYRAKHCVRETQDWAQLVLWADIDIAPKRFMEKSFSHETSSHNKLLPPSQI